jgi:hypothetical protein
MVEMVHGRITAGETTVVSTAAVLRCGNGKTTTLVLFLDSPFSNLEEAMDLSQDRLLLELTLQSHPLKIGI